MAECQTEGAEVSELEDIVEEDRLDDRVDPKDREAIRKKEIGLLDRMYSLDSKEENERNVKRNSQPADTYDGVVVILYHIDEQGKIYFSLEQKPETHPRSGKYALYGGTVRVGENHKEAAERELQEEDPNAYSVIIKALNDTHHKFTEVLENIDGVSSRTSIWAAEIKSPDWEKYKSTKTTEGYKTILSLEETIAAVQKGSFAYPQQAKALRDFIDVMLNSPKFYSTGLPLAHTPTYKPANLSSIMHSIN